MVNVMQTSQLKTATSAEIHAQARAIIHTLKLPNWQTRERGWLILLHSKVKMLTRVEDGRLSLYYSILCQIV